MYRQNEVLKKISSYKRVLITGGSGFIGSAVIRRLLLETNVHIFNLDKNGYASDQTSINKVLEENNLNSHNRYSLLEVDLSNAIQTSLAVQKSRPDLVLHLAAESHVDRSIKGPRIFLESNVLGTFNLLEACNNYFSSLNEEKQKIFRFHHVSTDEVFGSLGKTGSFSENSQYIPNSPYSASKAASDHFVNAWHHTFGLPVVITNCSNNYGPWQYPEKLIPLSIINAFQGKPITLYGDGENVRDWLFVEDHVDALLSVATLGNIGDKYCIGGMSELSNKEVLQLLCIELDKHIPKSFMHSNLIKNVADRKGHDYRYAVNPNKIIKSLGWKPSHSFKEGLAKTVFWYIDNMNWCKKNYKNV